MIWQDTGEEIVVLMVRPFSRRAVFAVACLLSLVGAAVRPSLAAEGAPGAPSTVTGGGVTLHSVSVEFPAGFSPLT